jgi:hypothetical protein
MIDVAQINEKALPRFEELASHLFPDGRRQGCRWLAGSADGEPGNSFSINQQTGVFGDFAAGDKMKRGAIALWMESRNVDFLTAVRELTEWLGGLPPAQLPTQTRRALPAAKLPYRLTDADIKRMAVAAHRLAREPELILDVFGERPEWNLGVIRDLALEGDLGFESDCRFHSLQGPAVLFGYRHGIKARWEGKLIRWLCGAAHGELWRQSLLLNSTRQVIITEGESDAITAVRFGLEDNDALVIALPGANVMPAPEPFAGRDIIFIPDTDPAGQGAVDKLRDLLKPIAHSVSVLKVPTPAKDLSDSARTRINDHIARWNGTFGAGIPTPIDRVRDDIEQFESHAL